MQFVNLLHDHGASVGLLARRGWVDLQGLEGTLPAQLCQDLHAVIEGAPESLRAIRVAVESAQESLTPLGESLEDLRIGPCVPRPGKIICVGLNYRRHAAESGMAVPETPVLFSKFSNAIAAHGNVIPIPPETQQVDYEAELVAVIGKAASRVREEDALDHVFGYCCGNDVSARDLQFRTSQWLLGKTLDGFFPVGPVLVTADEIPDPNALGIRCRVNGALRQNSNTADMIFSVQRIVSYVSQYFTLQPGDLISTGTPEGVALGMAARPWLQAGDDVVVEIDGLGSLRNIFA